MAPIRIWHTNFGEIQLPDDFPSDALTKGGWFDYRRKITLDIERYIHELERLQWDQWSMGGDFVKIEAPSFTEWLAKS